MYDVSYSVSLADDGELQVEETYAQGENTLEALHVLNAYHASETEVTIEAEKVLVGRDIEESDNFQFNLSYVERNGSERLDQTAGLTLTEDGRYLVRFEPKRYTIATQEDYVIREAIPEDAVQVTKADGTVVWEKNGITYDDAAHKVRVSVTDDLSGHLVGAIYYDDSKEAYDAEANTSLPVFTNTVFDAAADIEFNKEFYGNDANAQFSFVMMAADDQFKARENANGSMAYRESVVDNGQAFQVLATNDAFDGNVAEVHMPTIRYHQPGTYYYVITEMEDATGAMSTDASEILVSVVVDEGGASSVTYQVRANGVTSEVAAGEAPTLYNNANVSMAFRSRAFKAQGTMARFTNFEPAVKKVLKNGILTGGEFRFAIYAGDKAEGEPLEVVTNDANGSVSFDAIFFDDSNIGQTYEYTIVEVPTDDETVVFDEHPIRLTIKVSEGEDHEVVAEGTYSKATDGATYEKADDPTFVNTFDTIVIHAVKRSREEPYDPLPGAHYGLWMVNPNGEDVYMGLGRNQEEKEGSEDVSSANGDLYYDLPLLEGVAYYFLEEWPPPAGHLVDPYPTDYFTLVRDKEKGAFRFVYEADEDFSTYCPDVTPRA